MIISITWMRRNDCAGRGTVFQGEKFLGGAPDISRRCRRLHAGATLTLGRAPGLSWWLLLKAKEANRSPCS